MSGQRTRSKGLKLKLFSPFDEDERGAKKCCEKVLALADTTDSDPFKNDYKTVYFKRNIPTDTCSFELYKNGVKIADLNNSTFGTFKDFGDIDGKENWKIFTLDWRKVLTTQGAGDYYIKTLISQFGQPPLPNDSLCYQLREFSFELANKTVRIESVQNGILTGLDLDFKGLELADMIRVKGFFGNPNPKMSQDNIVNSDNTVHQLRQDTFNEYNFKSEMINYFASRELITYHFKGYPIYISDYNRYNHSYDYKRLPVIIEDIETPRYLNTKRNRKAFFSAKFRDVLENDRKINY